jgi:hypothetical protein
LTTKSVLRQRVKIHYILFRQMSRILTHLDQLIYPSQRGQRGQVAGLVDLQKQICYLSCCRRSAGSENNNASLMRNNCLVANGYQTIPLNGTDYQGR